MIVQGKKNGDFTFICRPQAAAKAVYLVGSFNRWNPTKKRMVKVKDGSFRAKMSLRPGEYQYKFVVDGVWIEDPDADQQVTNEHGTLNSIVTVA
ncbi:MAG: glycogen-binding domain-containing protein [Phycisphaerae bacterium]